MPDEPFTPQSDIFKKQLGDLGIDALLDTLPIKQLIEAINRRGYQAVPDEKLREWRDLLDKVNRAIKGSINTFDTVDFHWHIDDQ